MANTHRKTYVIGKPRKKLVLRSCFSRAGRRVRLSGPLGFAIVYFRDWKRGTGRAFKTIDEGAAVTGGVADKVGYRRVAYLAHLYVNPRYRGKGYGHEIMKLVETLDPTVDLMCLIANAETDDMEPKLHAFYRACGYTAWDDKPYVFLKRLRPFLKVSRRDTFQACMLSARSA